MTKINIIAIGKSKNSPFFEAMEMFLGRMRWPINVFELEARHTADPDVQANEENQRILEKIDGDSFVIAMDSRGKALSSEEISVKINDLFVDGVASITFVIGGSQGLNPEVIGRANMLLSMGKQTWPHMLARLMLIEQIYRSQQIIAGHPYHK